jgi:RNA polymerase sigma-70 factor (ECF subfamily)
MNQQQQRKLAKQAQAGDKGAFALLYRTFVHQIYAYFFVHLGANLDAQDLTTKTFMKALQNITQFQGKAQFSTWVYAIARNELVDFFRKQKSALRFDEEWHQPANSLEEDTDQLRAEKVKRVDRLLALLPEKYAQILRLRFLQNLSVKETAQTLGISESNVKVRQLRALQKARAIKENHDQ